MDGGEVDALHVDCVDAVEFGLGDFQVRLVAMRPAGVVHYDIELCARRADELRPVVAFRDVGLDERAVGLLCHALARTLIDVVNDDVRAFLGEALRDARAEARPGPGDDGQLSL